MRTPLYDCHRALGARMVPFAGWDMPVQYAGILAEHAQTRSRASLFDTCHMSEFRVTGPGAVETVARAVACRVRTLDVGRCRYGFLLNESGGVLDDLLCYRLAEDEIMIVANAGTRQRDAEVLEQRLAGVTFRDVSDATAKLDLQGPASMEVLQRLGAGDLCDLHYFHFRRTRLAGMDVLTSRTGYTGERGYELYVEPKHAADLWNRLLEDEAVEPAGLGARDTLRLEMALPLYGQELDESVTPVEANLDRFLPKAGGYVGAEAVAERARRGVDRRLAGIVFDGRRAARHGDAVTCPDPPGEGTVTSGSFAPSLGCAVALAYLPPACTRTGTRVRAEVHGSRIDGRLADLPFYTNGTAREPSCERK